jgi:hypothetical protein
MILVFKKRVRANYPVQYTHIAGPGRCIVLEWQKPTEVDDKTAYEILAKTDLVAKVEEAKKPEPKPEPQPAKPKRRGRPPKNQKVVEEYELA